MFKFLSSKPLNETEFLEREIARWKFSEERRQQMKGCLYYSDRHDILKRQRTVIGSDGEPEAVDNLPNNKIVYNLYGKLVDQKTNYLLGKPFLLEGENKEYLALLKEIFDQQFKNLLKMAGQEALNSGMSWLCPCIRDNRLVFKLIPAYEILPFWRDKAHTVLDMAVRVYTVEAYEGKKSVTVEKAEVYTKDGIRRYLLKSGRLEPDIAPNSKNGFKESYLSLEIGRETVPLNWKKIPLVPIKYNGSEMPLLNRVKSLQDGLNSALSDFQNNMQEDCRNTILVLKNYDGTDLGEFRKNLAAYGAVKVRSEGDAQGGVDTLNIAVNAENYKAIIEIYKKAIIEIGMGLDITAGTAAGGYQNMNRIFIKSMYTDLDLDADGMEAQLQAAFKELTEFACAYLEAAGKGDFYGESINVVFNRDMPVNESEVITDCVNSLNILSKETLTAQHPWVKDVEKEMERLKRERRE